MLSPDKAVPSNRHYRRAMDDLFRNNLSKVIGFYSSVYRVRNYASKEFQQGKERLIRKYSTLDKDNIYLPKIGELAYRGLQKERELWIDYQEQVLKNDIVERMREQFAHLENDYLRNGTFLPTKLRLNHNLESSWLFHRAYYKIFSDFHTRAKVFLDLDAFTITYSSRFFMQKYFQYLEGNYVLSVRGTGKVYIPHLQAALDSVDLPYISSEGIQNEHVIADYLQKSMPKDTKELLETFDKMVNFETDVIGGHRSKIFLRCSQYVNSVAYIDMLKGWLRIIGDSLLPDDRYKNRQVIIDTIKDLIKTGKLHIKSNLFNKDAEEIAEFIDTYNDDYEIVFEQRLEIAINRLLRTLFISLIDYSINRHRMEPLERVVERTEYETVFRRYRDMTLMEQKLNLLLIEDGEISFVLLLSSFFKNPKELDQINTYVKWGLIEKAEFGYKYTLRAKRMAKWYAKVSAMNLELKIIKWGFLPYTEEIDYINNHDLRNNYDELSKEEDSLFHWMRELGNSANDSLRSIFSEMVSPYQKEMDENKCIIIFNKICNLCANAAGENNKEIIKESVINKARFNIELNEFLRCNEQISRSVVAIPISTIPTDLVGLEEKIHGFAIFIGTFEFSDGLDDSIHFLEEAIELEDILRSAKAYFTLIGKPANEVLQQAVTKEVSTEKVEMALGRFAHALKNEGVAFRSRLSILAKSLTDELQSPEISKELLVLERAYSRLGGAISLLNLAYNKFQPKYLDKRKYCLLDVILRAYRNAFEQFYMAGPKMELDKLKSDDNSTFRAPYLKITVENNMTANNYKVTKKLSYCPNLTGVSFKQKHTKFTRKIDAEDILNRKQIFNDLLPERNMMHTAYLEIFTNALQYMKKTELQLFLEIELFRFDKTIRVDIINITTEDNVSRVKKLKERDIDIQSSIRGAGVHTNASFFANIGGAFDLDFNKEKEAVVATSNINLIFFNDLLKG